MKTLNQIIDKYSPMGEGIVRTELAYYYEQLENLIIEERAKSLFFRDMVDGRLSQDWYEIWEIEGQLDGEDKVRNIYLNRAKKELQEEEFI
jgi:hypothetical protein